VLEELDAQVTVDGDVQPVEAELLGPGGPPAPAVQTDPGGQQTDT
jgi:hypothetical protein